MYNLSLSCCGIWHIGCWDFVILLAELIGTCLLLLQANSIALDVEAAGSTETFNKTTRCLNSEDRTEMLPLFKSLISSIEIFKFDATNKR
jgi:hypothetical protein